MRRNTFGIFALFDFCFALRHIRFSDSNSFCCFTSQSKAMVMLGWSVYLTTLLSWASLTKHLTSTLCKYLCCNWEQPFLNQLKEGEWPSKFSHDQSPGKHRTWPGLNLWPPKSAIRRTSAVRHVTNCARLYDIKTTKYSSSSFEN